MEIEIKARKLQLELALKCLECTTYNQLKTKKCIVWKTVDRIAHLELNSNWFAVVLWSENKNPRIYCLVLQRLQQLMIILISKIDI